MPGNARVADRMRRHFIGVAPGESLEHVLEVMGLARVRALPVVEGDALLGILTYRTIARAAIEAALAGRSPRRFLELQPASSLLESPAAAASPDDPIPVAATRLAEAREGVLPVVEDGARPPRLLGVLTESDLLEELARPPGAPPGARASAHPVSSRA